MPGTMTNQPADTTFPCPFCRADVSPQAERCPQCGREPIIAGGYRVRSLLGRGGMGVVLGAERTSDGLPVAVKVLWLGEGVDWKAIELFERSTRVLLGLRHPLLPEVRAFERDERGTLILVRDRFDGGSLGERIRDGRPRLDRQDMRRLLEKLLGLLSYLHEQVPPVLHRDIKPDNILFRSADDWEPVLVDFDTVAAPGPQQKRLTVVCTPGYTAPEQLAGDPCAASDLYSLGATMLFVATGTEPDELPRRDGRFEVEPLLAGLDAGVRKTVLRMVEPALTERPRSAEEALRSLARGAEEEEPRAEVREDSRAEARRRREQQERRKEPAFSSAAKEPPKVELKLPKVTDTVPRKPWTKRIGIGVGVLAVVIGMYLAMCADDPSLKFWIGTQDVAEHIADFAVFRSGEKELLVGIEPIERTQFLFSGRLVRLTRIDGRSGKVLGRSDVGDAQWDVLGYGTRVLWLMEPGKCGLQARDPWTGNLLTDPADIARRNPGLAGRMLLGEDASSTGCQTVYSLAENGDDLLLRLRDGSRYLVKAGAWQAAPVEGEPKELDTWRVGDLAEGSGGSDFQLGTDYWELEGDERKRLRYENRATGEILDPLPGSETFLEGTFVCWGAYCDPPLTLTNPDGVLVTYQSGIDVHHPDMLARIARDGRTVWTFALGKAVKDLDEYRGLFQLAAHIVVVAQTQGEDSEGDTTYSTWLVALDAATGREAWRYRP
jgi:serine/threonine protein kinase